MNVEENQISTNVLLSYTGEVSLFSAVITEITCGLDMTAFPFDLVCTRICRYTIASLQQVCHIMLASWTYDASELTLVDVGASESLSL
jgi:hypothetical protein